MRNAQLVKAYPTLAAKRADLVRLRAEAKRILTRASALEDEIRELGGITRIRDGVALVAMGDRLEAAGDDIARAAKVYPNARNDGQTWGVYTYTDRFGLLGERWHGADLSQTEAKRIAETWVVSGGRPER
jgi:hypothetical protein